MPTYIIHIVFVLIIAALNIGIMILWRQKKDKKTEGSILDNGISNTEETDIASGIETSESFKNLDFSFLKLQANRWVDRHPEAKIEKIVLYRYASSLQKHLKGNVPSKYFVVFEAPENANTNELELDTEYYQTVKDGYKGLMCSDFNEVYKDPPTDKNFKNEWIFFVKKPSDVLSSSVMVDEPFWVLRPGK